MAEVRLPHIHNYPVSIVIVTAGVRQCDCRTPDCRVATVYNTLTALAPQRQQMPWPTVWMMRSVRWHKR